MEPVRDRLRAARHRLVCQLLGHKGIRMVDKLVVRDVDPFGVSYDITGQHFSCDRCGATLPDLHNRSLLARVRSALPPWR